MKSLLKLFVAAHVALYRATGGKLGGAMGGGKLLLLTTKGSKTGKSRTVPLMYFDDDGQRVVIASFGGAPTNPAWFNNLRANPEVTVEVAGRRYPARAEVAGDGDRARIWDKIVRQAPRFGEYQHKAKTREIPVVVLKEQPAA